MNGFQLGELAAIGLLTGVVGGMLGVGGSLVMIPAMTEILGPNQHLYQASAMIVNFFVVTPAVIQHRRVGAIEPSTVYRLIPLAGIAAIIGVGLSELPIFAGDGEARLRLLFGVFLLTVSLLDLIRAWRNRSSASIRAGNETPASSAHGATSTASLGRLAAVAAPTGLIAGLLGVGGGVLAVPLQRRLLGIPMRTAIANSAAIIVATSFLGAIVKNYAYIVDHNGSLRSLSLAGVLIPTAVAGSWFGSRLTHELPLRWVKIAFFILLSAAAIRITLGATLSR